MDGVAIALQCEEKAMDEHAACVSSGMSTADDEGGSVKSNHSNPREEDNESFCARSISKASYQSAFTVGLNLKTGKGPTVDEKKVDVALSGDLQEVPRRSFSGDDLQKVMSSGSLFSDSSSSFPDRRNSWPHTGPDNTRDASLRPSAISTDSGQGDGPPMHKTWSDNPALIASCRNRRQSFDLGDCRMFSEAGQTPREAGIRDAKLLAERRKKDNKSVHIDNRNGQIDTTSPTMADTSRQVTFESDRLISMIAKLDAKMSLLLEASKTHGQLLQAGTAPPVPEGVPSPLRTRRSVTEGNLGRKTSQRATSPPKISLRMAQREPSTHDLPGVLGVFDGDLLQDYSNPPAKSKSGECSPRWGTEESLRPARSFTGDSSPKWGSEDNLRVFRSAFEARHGSKPEVKQEVWNSSLLSPMPTSNKSPLASPQRSPKRSSSRANSSASNKSQSSAISNVSSSSGAGFGGAAFQTVMSHQARSQLVEKVWLILDEPDSVKYGKRITLAMDSFTIMSVCFTFLQLMSVWQMDSWSPRAVELGIDWLYVMEILARFIACPNRKRFFTSFYNMNDFIASVPVFILRSVALGMYLSRVNQDLLTTADDFLLCLAPVLRLLKLLRRFQKFSLLFKAFALAFEALPVLCFTLSMIILMFSSVLYLLEPRENIPHFGVAVYLTTITFTTVGYGEVTPETSGGQMTMCLVGMASALYMALPLGIIGSAFKEVWDDRDRLILLRRIRKTLLDLSLTAYDIPSLFRYFDEDKDGVLSIKEFGKMVMQMHLNMSNKRISELFVIVDKNGDGGIDDEEFTRSLFPAEYAIVYGPESVDNEDNE